jgi:predicted PurR-regulated permease PerM
MTPAQPELKVESAESETGTIGREMPLGWLRWTAISACGLFFLATLYTVYTARAVLIPITTALLLSFPLRPLLRWMARIGVPLPLGAALLVMALGGALVFGIYGLSEPAAQWIHEAPEALRRMEHRLHDVASSIKQVREATKQAEKLEAMGKTSTALRTVVKADDLERTVVVSVRDIVTGILLTLLILFFLLGWGSSLFHNLIKLLPNFRSRRQVVHIVTDIEHSIAVYLGTITLINMGLGVVVSGAMYLLGMPNPMLWGVVAATLNYIPYLGPLTTVGILSFVALLSYPSLSGAVAPPAVFLATTALEGQIVTPLALGRKLAINPLLTFVSVFFWYWVWGVIGALLAVPILVCARIVFEHLGTAPAIDHVMFDEAPENTGRVV